MVLHAKATMITQIEQAVIDLCLPVSHRCPPQKQTIGGGRDDSWLGASGNVRFPDGIWYVWTRKVPTFVLVQHQFRIMRILELIKTLVNSMPLPTAQIFV